MADRQPSRAQAAVAEYFRVRDSQNQAQPDASPDPTPTPAASPTQSGRAPSAAQKALSDYMRGKKQRQDDSDDQ